jgi:hypothetical protein
MHRITRFLSIATLAAAGFSQAQAADLTVPAGQTYVVGPAQSDLRLDHLTLGDNARITFAPGVGSWRVYAKQVSIGQNVVIDGRGADGAAGSAGLARTGEAKDCEEGRAGANGGVGGSGTNGVDMSLWWNVEKLGSLSIQAGGGNGGAGGAGSRGQNAGAVNRCEGPAGGVGGNGGIGGSGGKGGAIGLTYFGAAALGEKVRIVNSGGQPGAGGAGGGGGAASEGKFQRSATGERWYKGGSPGVAGRAGAGGTAGAEGIVQLQVASSNSGPTWRDEIGSMAATASVALTPVQPAPVATGGAAPTPSPTAASRQAAPDILQRLQDRIDDLEQRIERLEKR